jgi:hypothetical protein
MCNGQAVINPEYVYESQGEDGAVFTRTCAQAEGFARYITNARQCDTLLMEARVACCPNGSIPGLQTGTAGAAGVAGSVGFVASLSVGVGIMFL